MSESTPLLRLIQGDCIEKMKSLPDSSVKAVVTDPPYGLEFMGKDWDAPWKTGAGMTSPGIGDRAIQWPAYGGSLPFGGANPTCEECGGRLRGKKKCDCEEPSWRVDGSSVSDGVSKGVSEALKQKHLFQAWSLTWLKECFRVLKPGGIIKIFGATRMYHRMAAAMEQAGFELRPEHSLEAWTYGSGFPKSLDVAKALDKASMSDPGNPQITGRVQQFEGYGTALKPGWESILVGCKPE